LTVWVLIGKSHECSDVVLLEVVCREELEGVIELTISKSAVYVIICFLEQLDEGSLESRDESWGLDADLLRLGLLLLEVLHLCDVKLGNERVDWVSFLVDRSGVLELSSQMQLLLDFMFVLKHSIDPRLEHVSSHRVVQLVLERLVLKVELDLVLISIHLDDVKEDLDSSLGDGLLLGWLGELHGVLKDISVLLVKEDLVDIDL